MLNESWNNKKTIFNSNKISEWELRHLSMISHVKKSKQTN